METEWSPGDGHMQINVMDVLNEIPKLSQRQDAVTDQLKDLVLVADRLGMYDASDWIRTRLDKSRQGK